MDEKLKQLKEKIRKQREQDPEFMEKLKAKLKRIQVFFGKKKVYKTDSLLEVKNLLNLVINKLKAKLDLSK